MDLDTDVLRPEPPAAPPPALRIESLDVYEAHGGHTLRRHVVPPASADADRLAHEPHIHAAGTFTDRRTAQWVVEATIRAHQAEVVEWLGRGAPGALVLGALFTDPVGSELTRDAWLRGQTRPVPARGARVVLRRSSLSGGFYVLTAYPVLAFTTFAAIPYESRGGRGMLGAGNSVDVEGTRTLPGREHPGLWQFLGGCFHEDWAAVEPSWETAIDSWRRESPPELRVAVVAEIDALLAGGLDDEALASLLGRQLGGHVSPAALGMTSRAWLTAVSQRLGPLG